MITPRYTATMAAYNHWQNTNVMNSASQLSDADRERDLGCFFGSISQTCFHLVWGDSIWLNRFAGTPKPMQQSIAESIYECNGWQDYCRRRVILDQSISDWANSVSQPTLDADLTYFSGASGREITKPMGLLVTHFFNHQTHHRGQIHAMLTHLGLTTADTDMPLIPDEF